MQNVDNASGGYYVSALYEEGNTLIFTFDASVADTADIVLRVSSIVPTMTLTPDIYKVTLNDVELSYTSTTLTGTGVMNQPSNFEDAIVIKDVSFVEGSNTIKLITSNNIAPNVTGTTINGTAPEVDCIKVYTTTAVCTWEPKEKNLWYL
jgi:hypothetical protein